MLTLKTLLIVCVLGFFPKPADSQKHLRAVSLPSPSPEPENSRPFGHRPDDECKKYALETYTVDSGGNRHSAQEKDFYCVVSGKHYPCGQGPCKFPYS